MHFEVAKRTGSWNIQELEYQYPPGTPGYMGDRDDPAPYFQNLDLTPVDNRNWNPVPVENNDIFRLVE